MVIYKNQTAKRGVWFCRTIMSVASIVLITAAFLCLVFPHASKAAEQPNTARLKRASQIPSLRWEERSDWINIQSDVTPAAVGDGKADDTAAIQKALSSVADGSVVYFPPGTYRITGTLSLKNPNGARWLGGLIVGSGRDTRLVWAGETGGTMWLLNGIAYSIFNGFELDGKGKAGVGFRYKSDGFGTEVTHRNLAFRNFTDAGILEDPTRAQALAEVAFENCLFEECERGVVFPTFNDYDYTFDGCEFRRCGSAIVCVHGNFYVRNCHFEGSRVVDIMDASEHGSSVRRSTSVGSHAFITRATSVAPITIQDCHVDSWKSPQGAIVLSRPPALLFDCVFTNPPPDARGIGLAPIHTTSEGQRLIVSNNRIEGSANLVGKTNHPQLYVVPPGKRKGVIVSAHQSFLRDDARIPQRVFEAKRDFGARGDGTSDDTAAIQKTIDAASASRNSIAYLPSGRYVITRTLHITGRDYFVGGSGWATKLLWKGAEGGTMVEVRAPQNVTLENMDIGTHDGGAMNNARDILQTGSGASSHMTYDGVYAFGMYQRQPSRKGFWFMNLGATDVVVMPHVQGNLHFINSAAATVLANCSYEGSITVEGISKARNGFLGFQTRLATGVTHGLYLRDNHSIVMSDFYMEQSDNGYLFEGTADNPPGRVTIQGAKFQSFTSTDPAKNTVFDVRNYGGEIFFGPDQFYIEPKLMRMKQQGKAEMKLFLLGCAWYDTKLDAQFGPTAKLFMIGNEAYGTGLTPAPDTALYTEGASDPTLSSISRALDDLRRLGEVDKQLNHPVATK